MKLSMNGGQVMAKGTRTVGEVKGLTGKATVTEKDGTVRELHVGDVVHPGDVVRALDGATLLIGFSNGNFATVGSNDSLALHDFVIDPDGASPPEALSTADIQAMIAAGADPAEVAEATAAGTESLSGDPTHSGSHNFVVVDQLAARGNLTPGFETGTFAYDYPREYVYDGRFREGEDVEADDPAAAPPLEVGSGKLTVDEAHLSSGSFPNDAELTVQGSLNVTSPSGVSTIKIGDTVVFENGQVVAGARVETDEGVLKVTGYDPVSGKLSYDYTLSHATDEHHKEGRDDITHDLPVSVTDSSGVVGNGHISVTVKDDIPTLSTEMTGKDTARVEGNGLPHASGSFDIKFGADGSKADANGVTVEIDGQKRFIELDAEGKPVDGTLHFDGIGTLTVTGGADGHFDYSFVAAPGSTLGNHHFDLSISDSEGDHATGGIDVNIVNTPPVAADDVFSTSQNYAEDPVSIEISASDLLKNDSDPDGSHDSLFIQPDSIHLTGDNAEHFTLTPNLDADGNVISVTVTSNGPYDPSWGEPHFEYTTGDADGGFSNNASVTVTIDTPTYNEVQGNDHDNTITAPDGNNIVVGDIGGTHMEMSPGHNYNVSILIDGSNSMFAGTGYTPNGDKLGPVDFNPAEVLEKLNEYAPQWNDPEYRDTVLMTANQIDWNKVDWENTDWSQVDLAHLTHHLPVRELNRMDMALEAVRHLGEQYAGHDGIVNVQLVLFGLDVVQNLTFSFNPADGQAAMLKSFFSALADMNAALNDMDYIPGIEGLTNIEAAVKAAEEWLLKQHGDPSSSGKDWSDLLYLLTDGNPTAYLDKDGNPKYDGQGNETARATEKADDAFEHIKDQLPDLTINAIGMGEIALGNLEKWDSEKGQFITNPNELESALQKGFEYEVRNTIGADTILGGKGNDILFGDYGIDFNGIKGIEGLKAYVAEKLGGGKTAADITTAMLHDYIRHHASEFDWSSQGRDKSDILLGGAGDDIMYGQGGDDILIGGAGHNMLFGGDGNDILFGGNGFEYGSLGGIEALKQYVAEHLGGGLSANSVTMGQIFDYVSHHGDEFDQSGATDSGSFLSGGAGNDILYGQGGNDILAGGDGNNLLFGGDGNDLLFAGDGLTHNGMGGMEGLQAYIADHLGGSLAASSITSGQIADYMAQHAGEIAKGSSSHGDAFMSGGAGNDILIGGAGNDILVGGAGDNILAGGLGSDTFKWNANDLSGKVNGDIIADFHAGNVNSDANADILDIHDLIMGDVGNWQDLIDGGYLKFGDIVNNEDGSITALLMIDRDGSAGNAAGFEKMANITMDNLHGLNSNGDLSHQLLDQLNQNQQIHF